LLLRAPDYPRVGRAGAGRGRTELLVVRGPADAGNGLSEDITQR